MDTTIDVTITVDAEAAARALQSPARREATGRYLSSLLKEGGVRELLAEAISDAKRPGRANNLTDTEIDAELEAWRSERPT